MFGRWIKNERIKLGITMRKLCKQIEYDPAEYSKIERERVRPPMGKGFIDKLSVALKIDRDDLILAISLQYDSPPLKPLTTAQIAAKLPLVDLCNLSPEKADELIELIRKE